MKEVDLLNLVKESEVVEFCRELLKIKSVNPPGDELPAANYVAGKLKTFGLEVEVIPHSPNRASILARIRGSKQSPGILFNGHLDTVPVGVETWSQDPFGGVVAEGKIWGRGSADMKGGLAALMTAVKVIAEARLPLKGDLIFAATAGEEINSLGATVIASRGGDVGPLQAILIPEPSHNDLFVAEKGAFWLEMKTYGQTAHGSMPDLGRNAVMMMVQLIAKFEDLEIPFQIHPLLGGFSRSVNTISGGVKTNVVPDSCVATVDMRTVPGQDHMGILRRVEDLIRKLQSEVPGFKASAEVVNDRAPLETDANAPVVKSFSEVIAAVTGKKPVPKGTRYFTDGVVLSPAFKAPLLICGPGDAGLAHQPNEYVEIGKLVESARIYTLAALRFLA
jgi:succinyl-diaminopimelate desuccinylase